MGAAAAEWRTWGCTVRLVVTEADRIARCRKLLTQWLDEVDRACSRFRSDSELVAVDRAEGRPVEISPVLTEAIDAALRGAELTDSDVDPTVASALEALGYDRDFALIRHEGRPAVLTVRPIPGWRKVILDRTNRILTLPADVRLDLGATAKAWAADRAAEILAEQAGCGVLVALGGDIAVAGPALDDGWRIRVQDRTDDGLADVPHAWIALRDGGLATSSTTARRWSRNGYEAHHIIDPATGLPAVSPWRTVSVTAGSCLDANIASTAAMIRGEAAIAWLTELELPSRLVRTDGSVLTIAGWPADAEQMAEVPA